MANSKYMQGRFTPINPSKYEGDHTQIIYRSSWELKAFRWCDSHPSILKWSSEEIVIPYRCSTDGRIHRYFPDLKLTVKSADGKIVTYIAEIKPEAQCYPPQPGKRKTKRYMQESMTFIKNQSKWKYAEQYCKDRGWGFKVLTEKHLGI